MIAIYKHKYFFERQIISQLLIFSAGVDKIIKSFNESRTSSSSTTWVYARLQVPEHRLGGYSHQERCRAPDKKSISIKNLTKEEEKEVNLSLWSTTSIRP
jgi:hypothetical protein